MAQSNADRDTDTERAPAGDAAPDPRPRARKGEGGRLRGEVLDAAEALLVEKGRPEAISMREIAERVGVSAPSIYLHFVDKDDLFFQCCNRRFEELLRRLAAAATEHETLLAQLEAIGRTYVAFGLERAQHYDVMFVRPLPDSVEEDAALALPAPLALTFVARLVESGIASGELRDDLDPAATAMALWAAMHGVISALNYKRRLPDLAIAPKEHDVIDEAISMVIRGIRA